MDPTAVDRAPPPGTTLEVVLPALETRGATRKPAAAAAAAVLVAAARRCPAGVPAVVRTPRAWGWAPSAWAWAWDCLDFSFLLVFVFDQLEGKKRETF